MWLLKDNLKAVKYSAIRVGGLFKASRCSQVEVIAVLEITASKLGIVGWVAAEYVVHYESLGFQ